MIYKEQGNVKIHQLQVIHIYMKQTTIFSLVQCGEEQYNTHRN